MKRDGRSDVAAHKQDCVEEVIIDSISISEGLASTAEEQKMSEDGREREPNVNSTNWKINGMSSRSSFTRSWNQRSDSR